MYTATMEFSGVPHARSSAINYTVYGLSMRLLMSESYLVSANAIFSSFE